MLKIKSNSTRELTRIPVKIKILTGHRHLFHSKNICPLLFLASM